MDTMTLEDRLDRQSAGDVPRLLLRVDEAATATGISRAKLFELIASGEVPSIKVGRSRRIPVDALRAWIAAQVNAA